MPSLEGHWCKQLPNLIAASPCKSRGTQKTAVPPHSRAESAHPLFTFSFCCGRKKEETVVWFYSYPMFLVFLILFLILILLPSWKKHNSVKKGRRALPFVATTMALKKKKRQKLPTIGGTKNSTQKYNSTKSNKIGAEVQLFTACPSFAATSVTELQTPKHAAYGVRADPVRGPLAALDDLCHSGNARIHTKNKTEIKPQ